MSPANRILTAAVTIAVLCLAVTADAQCQSNRCPTQGGAYGQPVYGQPTYSYPPAYESQPHDDTYADDTNAEDDEYYDDEYSDSDLSSEFKAVECEVQVQHPLTFDWKTVKEFSYEEDAYAYQEQIEKRFWVIYQPRGAAGNTQKFLEAKNKSDARSQVSALRQDGNRVKQIKPVEVQVVEKSLSPIFAGETDNTIEDFMGAEDDVESASEESAVESALTNFAQSDAPQIQSELAPLVGLWKATTEQAGGEIQSIVLEMFQDGSATLTVPDEKGGTASINRDVSLTDGSLLLSSGSKTLNLGEVKSATDDLVVLARDEGDLTFQRQ